MNSVLSKIGTSILPPITKICYYSRDQINSKALPTIDELIRDSIKGVQSLTYEGIRELTPLETYESNLSSGGMNVDISKSTFYKTIITFRTHTGELLYKKMALPYLDRYGRMMSSDIHYNIKPIFTDNVISPHANGLFIKLHIIKSNISSIPYIISVNGIRENLSMIYSDVNKKVIGDRESLLNKCHTPIAFYLLSTYGLIGTLHRATKAKVRVVKLSEYEHDDNGIYYRDIDNPSCEIGFVVEMKERLDVIDNIITSVFYILKHTYNKSNELYDYIISGNISGETYFWVMLFGRFFYKGGLTFDKSTNEIYSHLDKVKNFLDTISKKDLKSIGIDVEDYIDVMLAILDRFNITILKHKDINSDIESSKKLNVIYYVLNQPIIGINSSMLEIAKREKARKSLLSTKEIDKILSDNITEKLIYRIVKSTKKNLAVLLSSGCTDNLLNYLLTSDDQNRGDGVTVNSNNTFPSSLRNIVPTHYVVGSMHKIGKKAPTPLLSLSPFVDVDANGKFNIAPILLETCKETYSRQKQLTDYNNHQVDDITSMDDLE